MKRRLAALSAVPLMLLLTACGSVQEATQTAANDAASKVATAAKDEVRKQVCAVAQDGLANVQDKASLGKLVDAAATAGLPSDITTPLGQIAASGDQVPAGSVAALKEACAA
ncbi:MAG TPA: hypothetical protein DIT15_07660 [Arthrobacter bacterium]|jgi:hypothetical protein|nr:hypothetical protein [Arthrobacter sp.]HBH57353.1 hypothetical protein [Arthrobacter sp.]HCB57449.1 hypothetical protein [Arthrobacter sp.]HCC40604.1 hypothetical protein [Arthrobacter sp.]HCN22108.1 hypothetical protein [Arthrobacter sp.]